MTVNSPHYRSFYIMFGLMLLSSLYFHANIGGSGFRIPNNILVWLFAVGIGFWGLWRTSSSVYVVMPRYFWLMLAFPLLALFSGMLAGVGLASEWFLRLFFIWGGVLFLFALFQFNLKQKQVDTLVFMLVIAGIFHAILGLCQIFLQSHFPAWLPINPSHMPTGTFQQINNQATFQATTLISALWLLSRPAWRSNSAWQISLLLLAIACSSFIISYAGSRIALLGLILALPLLLLSRWRWIKQRPLRGVMAAVLIVLSAFSVTQLDTSGLNRAADKLQAMHSGFSGDSRLGIYSISVELIKQNPLFGHGIGSFTQSFQLQKPDFYQQHPQATLPGQRVSHPHNETFFWLVEGGLTAFAGLLIFLIGIILALMKLPASRRYAYAAMIIPIGLHTQVELPFYISALHWFSFIFLLFVILHPLRRRFANSLTLAARRLLKLLSIGGVITVTVFLSHTMAANLEFRDYLYKKSDPEHPFDIALKNPYFKQQATHSMMTLLYEQSRRAGIKDNVALFSSWIDGWVQRSQNIAHYKQAIKAHIDLSEEQQACELARQAVAIYPRDNTVADITRQCDSNGL